MKHLTQDERYHIYHLLKGNESVSSIARELGRSKSTISEEIKRNSGGRGHRPQQAHEMAKNRASASHKGALKMKGELLEEIEDMIRRDWSPEQIAGFLCGKGISIHHESIYRFIYDDQKHGGDLYKHLRRANKIYKKRYGSKDNRGKIKNRRDIDERPEEANQRQEAGHFEGDTVKDSTNNRSIVTLVDRKTKLTLTASVDSLHADVVSQAIISTLACIAPCVKTITLDNGREFADHESFAQALGAEVFFAKPYHSWERGTNGLLRQYFPKRKVLFERDPISLIHAETLLNNRPRKSLGYKTPIQAFLDDTGYEIVYH